MGGTGGVLGSLNGAAGEDAPVFEDPVFGAYSFGGGGGGAGASLSGAAASLHNGGSIAGGAGGVGVTGANLAIVDVGTIISGLLSDGATRADTIDFTGGTNSLTLDTTAANGGLSGLAGP